MQSKRFRIVVYTAGSLTLNVAYAAYNGVLGLFYGSIWFMILGVYYGLLAVMRYMTVSYEKKLDKGIQVVSEVYVMRFTGMMFIIMSVVLMLIELYSMIHNTTRQYARLVKKYFSCRCGRFCGNAYPLAVGVYNVAYGKSEARCQHILRSGRISYYTCDGRCYAAAPYR